MVSFPTKKKVGTESSNEGRLLVSKTQSRRLTSDPAQTGRAHTRLYTITDTRFVQFISLRLATMDFIYRR